MNRNMTHKQRLLIVVGCISIFLLCCFIGYSRAKAAPANCNPDVTKVSPARLAERIPATCAAPTKATLIQKTNSFVRATLVYQSEDPTYNGIILKQVYRLISTDMVDTTYLFMEKTMTKQQLRSKIGFVGYDYDVDFSSTGGTIEWSSPMGNDPTVYKTLYQFNGSVNHATLIEDSE